WGTLSVSSYSSSYAPTATVAETRSPREVSNVMSAFERVSGADVRITFPALLSKKPCPPPSDPVPPAGPPKRNWDPASVSSRPSENPTRERAPISLLQSRFTNPVEVELPSASNLPEPTRTRAPPTRKLRAYVKYAEL